MKKTYWIENPTTAYLKEKSLNRDGAVITPTYRQIVEKKDYQKFIDLSDDDIKYEKYSQEDIEYFIKKGIIKGDK